MIRLSLSIPSETSVHGSDAEARASPADYARFRQSHSSVTETRWSYLGPIDGVLHVGIVTYRGSATRVISLRRASRNEREQYEQAHRRP